MPHTACNSNALPSGSEVLCTRKHRYRIERVLGQGGFGITYLATCLQDFCPDFRGGEVIRAGSRLAIKECFPKEFACRVGEHVCPRDDVEGSEWQLEDKAQLFLHEAETLAIISAQCRSDNLVPIYHCGRLASRNITFFVMPYVEGGTLTMHAGNLDAHQVADVLCQLLQALRQCHRRQEPMLHLDIKPDNIMLKDGGLLPRKFLCFTTATWQRWIPVLIDFGLARRSDDSDTSVRGLSRGYAPWEQADADSRHYIGPWTDVYALGATMYVLITGRRPPSFEERPPYIQGEDPYRPLMQMPWVVERFCTANPAEGRRLLQSIDTALSTLLPGCEKGSKPARWQDAGSWLQTAFPFGPWGPPAGFRSPF